MSIDINVWGVIPPDKKWNGYLKVLRTCIENNCEVPREVEKYLGLDEDFADWYKPYTEEEMKNPRPRDDHYVKEQFKELELGREVGIKYEGSVMESDEGVVIDLKELPKGVTKIRIRASY